MDRFDRIFELHKLLNGARRPVPRRRIEEALECSKATVKRIIHNMRLYLNAPIQLTSGRRIVGCDGVILAQTSRRNRL